MRIIAHFDMDAFFAAIEERDKPVLAGLPVVVGADPEGGRGRGVVSTANYNAREYGIHSAMPISRAWELSELARAQGKEPARFVGGDFSNYGEVSGRIRSIIKRHVPRVEQSSVDEFYCDVSATGTFQEAEKFCAAIKQEIVAEERLTASVGIGPNKLIAKIASDFRKPDGLMAVTQEEVEKFLEPLPIRKIPGIGPKSESLLRNSGIVYIRDLQKLSRDELEDMFGKWGLDMYEKARGLDDSEVTEAYETKSVGEQETFAKDTKDPVIVLERLNALCRSVIDRFREEGFKRFRTVVLMIRFADFETKTRAHTLESAAMSRDTLQREAIRLLLPFFDARENPHGKHIRLIGVRVEKLT